nr:MAG TPA: hypothetical protein [Microviridae sp.]
MQYLAWTKKIIFSFFLPTLHFSGMCVRLAPRVLVVIIVKY